MKKKYVLEPDLVEHGRYYIYEHSDSGIRCAVIVYHNFDLAQRIIAVLNGEKQ